MANYIEYNGKVAFHPGYYVKEAVEESRLTQQDFAMRLGTTPKNLSKLINGEQSLSSDMAWKLSRLLGTSMSYWQNLQNAYDAALAEIESEGELEREKAILRELGYRYFKDNFGLPDLPRKLDEQVVQLRKFLGVSSLTVLTRRDMAVSFRSCAAEANESVTVKANAMVQIATNIALNDEILPFNKKLFDSAVAFALTQTRNHETFLSAVRKKFAEAGVRLVILPNLSGSKTNGATKRVGPGVLLMVNDRRLYSDTFWFTLFHEIGHILKGDFGISFSGESGEKEERADQYARDALINPSEYNAFVSRNTFTATSVRRFADQIDRDPGIVLGRLQNDGYIGQGDPRFSSMRHKYRVVMR